MNWIKENWLFVVSALLVMYGLVANSSLSLFAANYALIAQVYVQQRKN